MKLVRLVLLLLVAGFILYVKLATAPTGGATAPSPAAATLPAPSSADAPVTASVPQKALDVLQTVRTTGQPPDGYVGGRSFENREGRLPSGGDYREFDVDPHHGQRNAERLIVEWNSKKAWYTSDHYRTFIPLP